MRGEASFQIGFIIKVRLSANFEVTSGESRNTMLPPIDVIEEIRKALDNVGNWRAVLPRASNQHVSLRDLPTTGAALVLHPFGALEISQKIAPLNIAIQRLGCEPARSRQRLQDCGGADQQRQRRDDGVHRAVRARAVLRPGRRREALAALVRALRRRASSSGPTTRRRPTFAAAAIVQYEVIYLPEPHPIRLFFLLATTLFQAFVRGRLGRAIVAVAGDARPLAGRRGARQPALERDTPSSARST